MQARASYRPVNAPALSQRLNLPAPQKSLRMLTCVHQPCRLAHALAHAIVFVPSPFIVSKVIAMKSTPLFKLATLSALALLMSACTSTGGHSSKFTQGGLPMALQVPADHMVAMETVGVGQITYECRTKKDMPSQYEWAFVGPDAKLQTRGGQVIGRYWGPPATWENNDGSKVTATQVAVAPAGSGNLPLQLVKAEPATGTGAMQNVSYIQRVATRGGVAPSMACSAANMGQKQVVPYQADYIFWKQGTKAVVKPQ